MAVSETTVMSLCNWLEKTKNIPDPGGKSLCCPKQEEDRQPDDIGDEDRLDESNAPAPRQAAQATTPCRLRKLSTAAGPPNSSKFVWLPSANHMELRDWSHFICQGPRLGGNCHTVRLASSTVGITPRASPFDGTVGDACAAHAPANSVNSIQFDVADKTAALKQARDEAVKDARSQAAELATAAGVSLGNIQSVDFYNNVPAPVVNAYGKGGGGGAEASVPIQTGQLTLTVTVSMSYEIK